MGKTAVIIIHGIGEQSPMGTVRGFVNLFAGSLFRSKPDRCGESFELRRLATYSPNEPASKSAEVKLPFYPPGTVFYEYYWASHYRDTKLATTLRWMIRTLYRVLREGVLFRLRKQLVPILLAWIVVLGGIGACVWLLARGVLNLTSSGAAAPLGIAQVAVGVIGPWLLWILNPVIVGFIGDAARYFGESPDSPVERQQIRLDGVRLLRRLHAMRNGDDFEYSRIVVVGHSLGSVIAYDILTHYWAEVNRSVRIPKGSDALKKMEAEILPPDPPTDANDQPGLFSLQPSAAAYRVRQHAVAEAADRGEWRISDFVTLGSPLTYSDILLATTRGELASRQLQRELPTAPPVRDAHGNTHHRASVVYCFPDVTGDDHVVPHHAAPFFITAWTNIYLSGDPVGGPLGELFGSGIDDRMVKVCSSLTGVKVKILGLLGGAHVLYWDCSANNPCAPLSEGCADILRDIIKGVDPLLKKAPCDT